MIFIPDHDYGHKECQELVEMVAEANTLKGLKASIKKNFPELWPDDE